MKILKKNLSLTVISKSDLSMKFKVEENFKIIATPRFTVKSDTCTLDGRK